MGGDVGCGEKLRRDEKRIVGKGAGTLLQILVGVNVAPRPAVDDDGARDIRLRKCPVARYTYRYVAYAVCGLYMKAILQHNRHRAVDDVDFCCAGRGQDGCT